MVITHVLYIRVQILCLDLKQKHLANHSESLRTFYVVELQASGSVSVSGFLLSTPV